MRESPSYRIEPLGDAALVLRFGERIDAAINARVLAAWRELARLALPGVLDLAPAYATLTVYYDPLRWRVDELAERLAGLRLGRDVEEQQARAIEIPVCYEDEHAPDLELVCRHTGLAAEELVRRHSAATYRVHFLGFTPGFPYLGGLEPALATPRRATPRLEVPPGSVAIGGAQTGIYSQRTPGGWNLIGRTPLALFDLRRDPACLLSAGDSLFFRPISAVEFARLAGG